MSTGLAFVVTTLPEALPRLTIIAAWFASLGVTCTVFWLLFDRLELTASQGARNRMATWLLKRSAPGSSWSEAFLGMFENVFGERHLSLKCVWRSFLASCAAIVCAALLLASCYPLSALLLEETLGTADALLVVVVLVLVVNVLGDYVSLWETRFVLRRLARASGIGAVGWLCLDIALTGAIYWMLSAAVLLGYTSTFLPASVEDILRAIPESVLAVDGSADGSDLILKTTLASTYVTSIWLYLFLMSRVAIRGGQRLSERIRSGMSFLDIERQPFRSLGTASVLVVIATYIAVTLGAMLWSRW